MLTDLPPSYSADSGCSSISLAPVKMMMMKILKLLATMSILLTINSKDQKL